MKVKRPRKDYVILQKIEAERVTAGGLFITDKTIEASTFALGKVVKIGPGIRDAQGTLWPIDDLEAGQVVAYSKMAAEQRKDSMPADMALVREGEIYLDMEP